MRWLRFSFCLLSVVAAQAAEPVSAPVGGQAFHAAGPEKNAATPGALWDYPAAEKNSRSISLASLQDWFSQGDIGFDNSGGRPAPQVSTGEKNNPAGAYTEFAEPLSLEGRSLRFRVKANNWKSLVGFSLVLAADGTKLANSLTLDIKTHIINPTDDQWFEIVAPVGDWTVDGNPDLSSLNAMLWKVLDNGMGHVSTQLADISVIANVAAAVSITLDDGLSAASGAKTIMDRYGLRGSICIDESALNAPGFLTQAQVDDFAKAGWDISGHQVRHNFRNSTAGQIAAHVRATADYLNDHRYKGAEIYAYPNGINDPQVNAAVANNFKYGMDIDGLSNTLGYVPPYRINRKSYDRYTTQEQMKSWVVNAKKNQEWLVLNFHSVSPDVDTTENISPKEFEEIINFIKTEQIPVAPVSEILRGRP